MAVFNKRDGSSEMIPCYYNSELDWKKSAWFGPKKASEQKYDKF